jgi:hypothetical protein
VKTYCKAGNKDRHLSDNIKIYSLLFNDAVRIEDHIASNGTVSGELDRFYK